MAACLRSKGRLLSARLKPTVVTARSGTGNRVHRTVEANVRLRRALEPGDDPLRLVGRVEVPDPALREHAVAIARSWTAIFGARTTSTSRCSPSRVTRRPSWKAARNITAISRVAMNRNAPPISNAVVIGPSLVGDELQQACHGNRACPTEKGRPPRVPSDADLSANETTQRRSPRRVRRRRAGCGRPGAIRTCPPPRHAVCELQCSMSSGIAWSSRDSGACVAVQ